MTTETETTETETPPEITADYIAKTIPDPNDSSSLDALPVEQQERIAAAYTEGVVTDEEVEAARARLAAAAPASGEQTDEEKAAAEAAAAEAAAADKTNKVVEEDEKSEAEILAEAREARRKEYDTARAELRKTLDEPEPERLTDAHDEWEARQRKAFRDLDELRENYQNTADQEFIATNKALAGKHADVKASITLERAIEASPVFAGKMKIEGGIAGAEKVYRPWLERLVKANGGDVTKAEDVNKAYGRFLTDKTFAADATLETPANIQQILIALTAKDLVKQGFTPRGALTEAAERVGVGDAWDKEHVQSKVNEATGQQTKMVKGALAAKKGEVRTAPAGAPGPGQIQSETEPYDQDSANAYLKKLMDDEDEVLRKTGKLPVRSPKQEKYVASAMKILGKEGE